MRKLNLCLLFLSAPAWSLTLRNPDMRTSFGFSFGGSVDVNSRQEVNSTHSSLGRDTSAHSLNFATDLLVPLADAWSVQAGGGLTSQQTTADEAIVLPGTSMDAPSATGLLSVRNYLLDRQLTPWATEDNPDRWPSIALTASGAASIYRDEIDIFHGNSTLRPVGDVQILSFSGDSRLPLSNALTLLTVLTGNFGIVRVDETASAGGNETRAQTLLYGGGFKYYFIGHDVRPRKKAENPDRWTSIAVTALGESTVGGHITTTSNGTSDTRDVTLAGWVANAELRVPVTDDLTLRLGIGGGMASQEVPANTLNLGAKSDTSTITSFVAFRHYFQ